MKTILKTLAGASAFVLMTGAASATSLGDVTISAGTPLFDGFGSLDYEPSLFGLYIVSSDPIVSAEPGFTPGATTLNFISAVSYGSSNLLDYVYEDNGVADDILRLLYEVVGGASFLVAEFTGDLDAGGTRSFLTQGIDLQDAPINGNLTVRSASLTPAIPLPATLPLLLAGVGGIGYLSRRRKA